MSETKKFKGFIAKLNVKEGQGRKGPWRLYSAKVEKDDGTEYPDWITLGFDEQFSKSPVKQGDYVGIEASQDNGRWKADRVVPLKNAPARTQKQKPAGNGGGGRKPWGGGGGGNKFDGTGIQNRTNPEDAKRMSYANARSLAVEVVTLLLANDALPVTSAKGKAGEAKREAEIAAYIDKYTVQYHTDGITLRLLDLVEDPRAGTVKAADGELPDKSDSDAETDEEGFDDDDSEASPGDADDFDDVDD